MRVLVTGGAGYIGAHAVRALLERGDEVVVADDLSTGDPARIPGVPLERIDLSDPSAAGPLAGVLRDARVDAVIHFAAKKRVDESVERPAEYWLANLGTTAVVLLAMREAGIRRLVFSSTAAVYGELSGLIDELSPCEPISPYGDSKLAAERLVASAAAADGIAAASLRYFNVAGVAAPELAEPEAHNLIPLTLRRIDAGLAPQVYGTDYPTRDGTCVRDFVHVVDVAEAHLAVLDHLDAPGHRVYNIGTGRGSTVLEVIGALCAARGMEAQPEVLPRRPGDAPESVADVRRIADEIGWRARLGLDDIVRSVAA